MWPLYAAGFTTAFGAHGIAANLGGDTEDAVTSLLVLGGLLALYDGAEVLLKPVFGTLADRIGARPVLLGGLIAFAVASALYAVADSTRWLWAARLGQRASASAFSPAASALVARLNPAAEQGRAFGSYGFHKSVGYTLGPLLGGVLVWAGGLRLLFVVLAGLGALVAVWALVAVPVVPPLPRSRQTVVDLVRRLADPVFLVPTAALAGATAALSVGVGFLPVSGTAAGLGPVATGAAVPVLAACAAVVQPRAGRALDEGRIGPRGGLGIGLALAGAGLACATLPGLTGVLLAAALIGVGTGLITPLGFAALASSTPRERLGQTMGAAELGRELGDAGGPLLVAGVAAAATLSYGYGVLAVVLVCGAVGWRVGDEAVAGCGETASGRPEVVRLGGRGVRGGARGGCARSS
ncbi:arabinose efflux permease family protein [Streptomyces lincolnensis]|uniref:Arabinose efflux permease family protein n=1 Tax=Streptomyces lincolnensis TaxID=1915 RepID=A0A1B1MKG6_STRLN|nr:MFS transporter [Streptomyces lincolnensis]ANS69074.1 arabinose efflux permease family protein [Streptomyces lincolnensis]AXG57993.1 arabinose efflux permease family protein [Streptomyces lincolnensis]QMV10663.1 MFS transporter [Streptomyces lincolnensis]